MWNRIRRRLRTPVGAPAGERGAESRTGLSTFRVETTREVVTAERLDKAFCGELLGVSSFVDGVNPFEVRVMKRLDRMLGRRSQLAELVPRVPAVIPRLLRSLRDENRSGHQLAAELSRDVVLVADAIRYASSAYYRTREPIKSLEQAVLMLGRDGLQNLLARAAFKPLFDSHKDHFSVLASPLLWRQAERCAVACECIARREGVPVFEAFLAGLINKVGYRIVARVLGEEHRGADAPRSFQFRDWLTDRAPALSWRVAAQWDLPASVTDGLKGLLNPQGFADTQHLSGVVYTASKLSELYLLSISGRIKGDMKRFACRVNGRLVDYCSLCYAEMSRLDQRA